LGPATVSLVITEGRFGLVYWCLMALSAQTGYIMLQEYVIYYIRPGDKKIQN